MISTSAPVRSRDGRSSGAGQRTSSDAAGATLGASSAAQPVNAAARQAARIIRVGIGLILQLLRERVAFGLDRQPFGLDPAGDLGIADRLGHGLRRGGLCGQRSLLIAAIPACAVGQRQGRQRGKGKPALHLRTCASTSAADSVRIGFQITLPVRLTCQIEARPVG